MIRIKMRVSPRTKKPGIQFIAILFDLYIGGCRTGDTDNSVYLVCGECKYAVCKCHRYVP